MRRRPNQDVGLLHVKYTMRIFTLITVDSVNVLSDRSVERY